MQNRSNRRTIHTFINKPLIYLFTPGRQIAFASIPPVVCAGGL